MSDFGTQKTKLSQKLSEAVGSRKPLRALAQMARREVLTETTTLTVERVAINLKRLPKKLDGFRIAQLSDLHHSPFTSLELINEAIRIANNLAPEMFVLTGDFVSHDTRYIAPVADALSRLASEFGSFACLGNHDHWTDAALVTDLLRGEGITVLINEGFRFKARGASFWLCGVDDLTLAKTDVKAALTGAREDEMKILLAHNPKILYRAARRGVDLMLSGHTHGGQVKLRDEEDKILPTRRLTSGLYRRKNTQVYITRGIGTVVVPMRYHCPPEITLIELRTANK
ncbi:MAG: metallophosphoesterase [Pyrinomonadaceae bacterium]